MTPSPSPPPADPVGPPVGSAPGPLALDPDRLRASWADVARYGDQVPLFFYSSLFLAHPSVRDMFPLAMAGQRDKLVAALAQVITHVDDLASVVPVLQQLGRDHRRFAVIADHYPAVGAALLSTLAHFLGDSWDDQLAGQWATAYELVARVMLDAADAAVDQPPWYDATVSDFERRTASVAVLRITPAVPIPYRAGQSLAMECFARPRLWRYYSPATLPAPDGSFEMHVRAVAGGPVSTGIVQGTRVGDPVRFGAPVGDALTLDNSPHRDLVMIAGGTGLAPMKSLLHELDAVGDHRHVQLFWGGRRHVDLYDLPAIERIANRRGVRFVACLSEDRSRGFARQGTAVEVALAEADVADHDIYVCGSPAMVDGTRTALAAAGVASARVHYERFGHQELLAHERP
jgi:NAD(P)H-flavin reductase/hemoglobin-like flavoprotein